jgi:hypothetical protein
VTAVQERPTVARIVELPVTHLMAMSDHRGLFEHADHEAPRREHGYCLDDVARGLVVAVRLGEHPAADALLRTYLRFAEAAVGSGGRAHNRLNRMGAWTDEPGLGDWWGRAIQGLGFVAASAADPALRQRARVAFDRAARQRSPHLRAMVFAGLGAVEVLAADPASESARELLVAAVAAIPEPHDARWPWPERRLRYGNAAIAEVLLAAGAVLDDVRLTERGLAALSFLVLTEVRDGHLSVTGVGGRGPGEHAPQFDQQPIEVAAIADACARAHRLGHGEQWAAMVRMSWAWFLGDNDVGVAMFDPVTGAGYDGLEAEGRNENRGAESTLAALSTFQQLSSLAGGRR